MYLKGISEDGGYIVVPEEDVIGVKYDEEIINKRNDNNTDSEFSPKSEERNKQVHNNAKYLSIYVLAVYWTDFSVTYCRDVEKWLSAHQERC